MVQSQAGPRKVLEQARRRTIKAPDERRRDLLGAAAELFAEAGFEATSVQAVARKAGVATGTVYLYFASKEAILTALEQDFDDGLIERIAEISEHVLAEEEATGETIGYREAIERLIDGTVAFALENRLAAEVIARHGSHRRAPDAPILEDPLTELLARIIQEGVRLGYVHTSDPQMSAYLLNAASATAIGHALAFEDEETLDRVVRAVKELYIKALAPSP